VSAGTYINYRAQAGTKNKPDMFFVLVDKEDLKIEVPCFEPKIPLISFLMGFGPPSILSSETKAYVCRQYVVAFIGTISPITKPAIRSLLLQNAFWIYNIGNPF